MLHLITCHGRIMPRLAELLFSYGGHFVQPSRTILAILEEHLCEIVLKSSHQNMRKTLFKYFSSFSSGGHFVQPSRTILAILEEHFCEIILKSGNWPRRICDLKIFLFLALAAILFSCTEPF